MLDLPRTEHQFRKRRIGLSGRFSLDFGLHSNNGRWSRLVGVSRSIVMDPLFDRVAERAVSGPPLCSHPRQDWYCRVHIVDDENVRLPGIQSAEPSHILGQCPLPRDRHCQEQRIEPCIVEAFAMRYLCTKEAARFLSLSARTLEKHRSYGTGPLYRKIGGRVVYAIAICRLGLAPDSKPRLLIHAAGPAPARRRKTTADCEQNVDTSRD